MVANLICFDCKHFNDDGFGCKAFAEGIPIEITDEGVLHDEPFEGQSNNIVFEKR